MGYSPVEGRSFEVRSPGAQGKSSEGNSAGNEGTGRKEMGEDDIPDSNSLNVSAQVTPNAFD